MDMAGIGSQGVGGKKHRVVQLVVGERVRMLRMQRGWSQEVLADLSRMHRNYIGHVERGEVNAGLQNLLQLAEGFEMSLSEFFKGI